MAKILQTTEKSSISFYLHRDALPYLKHIEYKSISNEEGDLVKIELEPTSYNLNALFHAGVSRGIDMMANHNLKTA